MDATVFSYPVLIKETYLDIFGHMNHATYLTLFEDARWDLLTQNGYGLKKIIETGIGPAILEVKIRYLKELVLRDEVVIKTQITSYEKKTGTVKQHMLRAGEICSDLELVFGLFSLKERKLVLPSAEWLQAMGVSA